MSYVRGCRLVLLAVALLAGCKREDSQRISGDTLEAVAISVYTVGHQLPPDERRAYTHAVEMLGRTAPDRYAAEGYMSITPNLVQRLKGRTPAEVIRMVEDYRAEIPQSLPGEGRRRSGRRRVHAVPKPMATPTAAPGTGRKAKPADLTSP